MIINFHTHIFPDSLAPRAVASLLESAHSEYTPVSDGTASGLIREMDGAGIDKSVIMPVITKRSQTQKSNEFAASVQGERIIAFGGIYPSENYKEDIDFVVSLGLKGIKLHAEYQDFIVDSPEMLHLYDYAFSKGLIIMQHAGYDPAYKPPFRSNPQMFANVAKQMKGGIMIAAHLGGQRQWDDVEKYIVGTDIYIDTSMGFSYYPKEQFIRIVKNHGADKILFGTDSPWSVAADEKKTLENLPLPDSEKRAIFGENAIRILNIK